MSVGPARVVVIGGGVAGLTTAYRLRAGERRDGSPQTAGSAAPAGSGTPAASATSGAPATSTGAPPAVTLVEADRRLGGKVRGVEVGSLFLEAGADSFVARKPWAVELCRELGLGRELRAPAASGAYLWTNSGLVRYLPGSAFGIPGDVGEVLRWPGLSRPGRLRAAQDLIRRPRKDVGDEALGSLLRRRLGDEATELAVAPLLAGLFAGDIDRLSAEATFPELVEWERRQGSLIRGAQAARRAAEANASTPMFLELTGGTSRLTDALVAAVGNERMILDDPARALERRGHAWTVRTAAGSLEADAVVLATPAFESARLLRAVAPAASAELARVPYASTAVVLLVYSEGTAGALPDGTGFVVPSGRAPMTACTWLSSKWPRPEYGSRAVVRCYVGGVGFEDLVDEPDDELVPALARHLSAVVSLPPAPASSRVVRWRRSMPQYEVGHRDLVRSVRGALPRGIFVTGSAFAGAGIPDCVRDAGETAADVRYHLAQSPAEKEKVR
jgi:protoporphyrinogen/coproporphyrinogen III oxidase